MMYWYFLIPVIIIVLVSIYLWPKNKVKMLSVRKKIIKCHGLGGFIYEYKIMGYKDFYGNSREYLSGEWQVKNTLECGAINPRVEVK